MEKKIFTNQRHLANFPAAHFSLGTAHCPVGFLLLLGVFPLIVGHMASLVLFNFDPVPNSFSLVWGPVLERSPVGPF